MAVLDVSCAVHGRYVPHSAAMLHSAVVASRPDRVRVHYLHAPELAGRAARRLRRMVEALDGEIVFHPIDAFRVADLPVAAYFTAAMWYRILLPDLLPNVDRILYLDVDTIVVEQLGPLWDIDLRGSMLGAVTNVFEPWRLEKQDRLQRLGLSGPEAYFNSGVLLMHLAEMRRERAGELVREYAVQRGPELFWPDQDALNVVLGDRRVRLHPRWNVMNAMLEFDSAADVLGAAALEEARAAPAIRHFEGPGPNKPWHAECPWPHRDLYFEHRRQTPWPRGRLEGLPRRAVARRVRQRLAPMRAM